MVYRGYDGFIQAVDDTEISIGQPDPSGEIARPWAFYGEYLSIILLGQPRHGKTTEFQYQCDKVENGFFLPLRDLAAPSDIGGAIRDIEKWRKWQKTDEVGELFIDSLDEGKLEAKNIINHLVAWVRSLSESIQSRLRIHLSCRRAEWDRADSDKWFELFTQKRAEPKKERTEGQKRTYIVIELLDLTRKEIQEFCKSKSTDPDSFLKHLPRELYPLASRPMMLDFLVEEYIQSGGHFPANIQTLYESIIKRRLLEHNEIYNRAVVPEIGPKCKRAIAEHYAVICTLSNREIIAPYSHDPLTEVQAELSGHGLVEELVTFKTDLFQPYNYDRFRFNEPELSEYLCSKKLDKLISDNVLSAQKTIDLLFPSPSHEYPVPILHRVVVWLAALNSDFRTLVHAKNPGILINDYIRDLTSEDKVKTWKWLTNKFGDREWFDDREWYDEIGVLACDELVPDLIEVIGNTTKYGFTLRILAIELARQGKVTNAVTILSDIVTNSTGREPPLLLSVAGKALAELGPSRVKDLETWLNLPPDIDPDNELLTEALETLWPDHIDLEKLIESLRPQGKYYGGVGYRIFLSNLSKQLNPEHRAHVLSALATELKDRIENRHRQHLNHLDRPLYVSDLFGEFLLPQLNDWRDQLDRVPLLELWVSLFDEAREYGIINEHDPVKTIADQIGGDYELRQALCLQYVKRIYKDGSKPFRPFRFWWAFDPSLYPNKEDLPYWRGTLERWLNECPDLIPVAWDALMIAWRATEFSSDCIPWIEDFVKENDVLEEFWENDRTCSLETPRARNEIKQAALRKLKEEKREQNIKKANQNLAAISSGDFDWIRWLTSYEYGEQNPEKDPRRHRTEAIEKALGKRVGFAYLQGLQAYWSKVDLPSLSGYYISNSTPWSVILVLQAVDAWRKSGEKKWSDVPSVLRKSALQAGLSELGSLPVWYKELVFEEKEAIRSMWNEALDLEADSSGSYAHLANLLSRNKDFELCREIAAQYLRDHESLRIEVAGPLVEAFLIEDPGDEILNLIEAQGKEHLAKGSNSIGLVFLAVVWRYRQERVWHWVEENYLKNYGEHTQSFSRWILALEGVHCGGLWYRWPEWARPDVLLAMLPDFLRLQLSDSRRGGVTTDADRLRFLRDDCVNKLAESGNPVVEEGIICLIDRKDMINHRNLLLDVLDQVRRAAPKQVWHPLAPEEVWEFIEKNKHPVRNHQELYDLTLEIVYSIRIHIQTGESNLKLLFWTEDSIKKPRHEETFQIVFFDQLQHHPLGKKIIGVRELEISGGNKPDVLVACRTLQGEKIKVYIEIKRQLHDDLLTSPDDQLAGKYLIDPEARNGIYVVGWFGASFYGPSNKTLQDACGTIPGSAEALESCLQKISDEIVSQRHDIDALRVVVINLER